MIGDVVVDATVFLGMHSTDERIRRSCKTFFAQRVHDEVWMSLEQVGWCDDVVWQYPRTAQDAYYPFMDTLHTDMAICRFGYDERGVDAALATPGLADLPMRERLLIGMVLRHDAVLYTANPRLCSRRELPVVAVPVAEEQLFPDRLEEFYRVSLVLRFPPDVCEVNRCIREPSRR